MWSLQKMANIWICFWLYIYCANPLEKRLKVQLTPDDYIVCMLQRSYLNTCSKSSLLFSFLKWCPDSMLFTAACVHATCRSTVHMHIFRWLAALRHKATSPLFPVYSVWGFLFSVSLCWLICVVLQRCSGQALCKNEKLISVHLLH